jgi:predicted DNA-binding transcriptional regulator YafY
VNVEQRLREAIQAGETLKIVYNGGSNPGALREIAPISLSGDKLSAHCYSSNAVKSFAIDRIVLVDGQSATSERAPEI